MHASKRSRFASFMANVGGEFGPDGFGAHFRIGRLLDGGDLRLVVLLLLAEAPRHGYDLIKAIEERSSGVYSPSPGVIYPALTFLEEAGYAVSRTEGNKKIYEITAEGGAFLEENRSDAEAILEGLGHIGERAEKMRSKMREHRRSDRQEDRDIPGVLPEVNEARKALKSAIANALPGDEDTQRSLAEILKRAAEDINRLDVDLG